MQKYILKPLRMKYTQRTEWKMNVPPDYDHYSIEALNGFLFNQVFIESEDKLKLQIPLLPILKYINGDDDGNKFLGFYSIPIFQYDEDGNFLMDPGDFCICDYIGNDTAEINKFVKDHKDDDDSDNYLFTEIISRGYGSVYKMNDKEQWEFMNFCRYRGTYKKIDDFHLNTEIKYNKNDFIYILNDSEENSKLYLYDEDNGFEDSGTNIKIERLMTIYNTQYTDNTPLYDDLHPDTPKEFELVENPEGILYIELNLYDDVSNEFINENEMEKSINKFRVPPAPFAIKINNKKFDKPKGNDTSRYFFRTTPPEFDTDEEVNAPFTFNSQITTINRKTQNHTQIGVREIKGSSIFDQFIQYINLHLACALYDIWIRSETENNVLYYRAIDLVKFASGESSYNNNYVTTLWFYRNTEDNSIIEQQLATGYDSYFSTDDDNNDTYFPILLDTKSLKLGTSDTRIVYPVTILYNKFPTYGLFKKTYNFIYELDERRPEITSDLAFTSVMSQEPTVNSSFGISRIYCTRNFSFQFLGRDIGYLLKTDEEKKSEDFGSENIDVVIEISMLLKNSDGVHNDRIATFHGMSYGYFNLWSPHLYITSADPAHMNISTHVEYDRKDSLVNIINVAFMFNQTSMGFNWMSNNLPMHKIPIGENKSLHFKLLDFAGRGIPLADTDSGLYVPLELELNLYKKEPETNS